MSGAVVDVRAPGPGWWEPALGPGQLVRPGDVIGHLDVLGRRTPVRAPEGARGVIVEAVTDHGRARIAVGHGTVLVRLDPTMGAASAEAAAHDREVAAAAAEGLVLRAPSSGRFYSRPGPGKPAFVTAGDVVRDGQTVCLLEVMKTFNRVVYGGPGLPATARVIEVVAADESDVDAGAVLLRVEPQP